MVPLETASRKDYLALQKQQGRNIMGVFPGRYPRELFWALNVLPVEVWDPPGETSRSSAHLQPFICSVVKAGLELVLAEKSRLVDGFVFPHTCDSIQNLGSLVQDYLKVDKPCLFFYSTKAPHGPAGRLFQRREIQRLGAGLERIFGPIDPQALRRSVEKGREIRRLTASLYALRAQGKLDCSNVMFYRLVRLVEYMHPDDIVAALRRFLQANATTTVSWSRPCLVLSGVLPGPVGLLSLLDDLGVRVGDDDLLSCGRRMSGNRDASGDPLEVLTEDLHRMPACSTLSSSLKERCEQVSRRVKGCGAGGVLFNVIKFCEPELFYYPGLRESLQAQGVPCLLLEQEVDQDFSGQAGTRVEAFVEMIRD